MATKKSKTQIVSFPSDKNGCGFYRTYTPLNYGMAARDWSVLFLYQFVFDINLINTASHIRFQRQCTENQLSCIIEYKKCIENLFYKDKSKKPKIIYELDDLAHEIEPCNVNAYVFYTKSRKDNVVKIMQMSDTVTVSTDFLKHYYETKFNLQNIKVVKNYLPKYAWNPDFSEDKRPIERDNNKPVIIWAGSASHIGKGGDLEFLLPMIKKTLNEFDWMFIGVVPEDLKGKVKFVPWANFLEYPSMMQNIKADLAIAPIKDTIFNYAKSDLKYLEYSAMNIPSILSSVGNGIGPYDQTNGHLVDNDPDDWYMAIKEILSNEDKYNKILEDQQAFVNTRWLENNFEIYESIYGN